MSIDDVSAKEWDEAISGLATSRQVGGDHYKNLKITLRTMFMLTTCLNLNVVVRYWNKDDRVKDLLGTLYRLRTRWCMVSIVRVTILGLTTKV